MPSLKQLERIVEERLARGHVKGLFEAMKRGRDGRARAIEELGEYESFRAEVRRIKERCIERLPELIDLFKRNAEARGARVYLAGDAAEANEITARIIRDRGARLTAKSKSLTSEEIELNAYLESRGIEVVETDLGERIIQLAGERPSHLVFPAVHKTRQDIAHLFSGESGRRVGDELPELMGYIRARLRSVFLAADVGITGANIGIAENGAVVIETNEGNARLVSSLPKTQIVIMGVEKLVETVEDALYVMRAHPVAATGQRLTTYVTLIAGRLPLTDTGEERELHIVMLDNGRLRMRRDRWFREALYCIRCGACMNICAPYSVVGGHVFGHIYPGPIGIPWTANVHGIEEARFSQLCISCGLCHYICPAGIDIPMMISRVKQLDAEASGGFPKANRYMMSYERLGGIASATAPLSNWVLRRRVIRELLSRLMGIDSSRTLPVFKRGTFMKRVAKMRTRVEGAERRVALFLDFNANYVEPEIAESLARALVGAGVDVVVPPQLTSGYPFIAYGDLDSARRYAEKNVASLVRYVDEGYVVLSIEPTATYAIRHSYPRLLEGDGAALRVAARTMEALEYLALLCREGLIEPSLMIEGEPGLHVSCHQRVLGRAEGVMELFRRAGREARLVETGMCCGMGGTFGLKKGPIGAGLSGAMGSWLFRLYKESGVDYIVTESSVCRLQLEEGTGIPVMHPLRALSLKPREAGE